MGSLSILQPTFFSLQIKLHLQLLNKPFHQNLKTIIIIIIISSSFFSFFFLFFFIIIFWLFICLCFRPQPLSLFLQPCLCRILALNPCSVSLRSISSRKRTKSSIFSRLPHPFLSALACILGYKMGYSLCNKRFNF